MGSECEFGKNGCVAVQDVLQEFSKVKTQQKNDGKDLVDLWKVVGEIRGLLTKAIIGISVLTTVIQIVFKFWNPS